MNARLRVVVFAAGSLAVLLGTVRLSPALQSRPARFIYAWAGSGMHDSAGINMIAVFDADPASARYGRVIGALTVDSAGRMPHHSEFSAPENGSLFVNDFGADKSYLIDMADAAHPRLDGRMDAIPGARQAHSFARLPNHHVLATVQFGDGMRDGDPGVLAEFDANGKLLRYSSAADSAFAGARLRPYGLAALPAIDRVVTTSSPMGNERTANVVQIWRLSDLRLLKTLPVPVVEGDSLHMYPFELRTLADQRTVMMNTYYCGFYTITNLSSDPKITAVMRMAHPKNIGCSVPIISGRFMLMPIAYAHRFATIDISDPLRPREVQSLQMDSTFFPHWASGEAGGNRVVVTDQGDGPPRMLVGHLDQTTGKLSWDERFRDPGSNRAGISFDKASWPNGFKGIAMPHGAIFVR
ncbi:MAG: hypothetical protein ABIS03_03445 [Gemmatimonadaceae bacterium]